MTFVGLLAAGGFTATLWGSWVRFETTFGQRDLVPIDADWGRLALVLSCTSIACFLLVRFVRGAALMIPAFVTSAVSSGIAIAAVMDPLAMVERSGVIAGAAEPAVLGYVAVACGALTMVSALAAGWDARKF
jgi:hypothetical protein